MTSSIPTASSSPATTNCSPPKASAIPRSPEGSGDWRRVWALPGVPKKFNDKVVVRAGTGLYYDRGELYSYLSPGFAEGVINGGPFGVNQTPPYVNAQSCSPSTETLYEGFIPTCPSHRRPLLARESLGLRTRSRSQRQSR